MGCIPSSTYPEHAPRANHGTSGAVTPTSMQSGSDFVFSRAASSAQVHGGDAHRALSVGGTSAKLGGTPPHVSPTGRSPSESPPLRLRSKGDVGADGAGLATTYTTTSGRKFRFLFGRPTGFAGAEDIISCLDDGGMQGNLYRLVRSKLLSIGEEETSAAADDVDGAGRRHSDTLSESEAREREQGMDAVACSVTARRASKRKSLEAALQEQYVVALLGTDTIMDTSAVAASRRRPRLARVPPGCDRSDALNTSRLSATQAPPSSTSSASSRGHGEVEVKDGAGPAQREDELVDFDSDEDKDYQLHPQEHYSVLPAQRKSGAAVPLALCPPSRTLRVPVEYSAVEDRVVAPSGEKGRSWRERVMPPRVFRLATSETRTWAFFNDSEYVMHVFTLFDRASKLEPRDSTRLWSSSVFDDGNEAPTPPPVFFGLFFDEDGEEAVPTSEMPDSVAHRQQQRVFGTRGMWIAELLVPPRSTRMFVEGKIRGAYRMRCSRLALDDVVAATEMAQAVARRRNARHAAERSRFSLRRVGRGSASGRPATGPTNPLATAAAAEAEAGRGASAPAADRQRQSTPPLERSLVDVGCHSTLTESQGVLTRQTFIRHGTAAETATTTTTTTAGPRAAPTAAPTARSFPPSPVATPDVAAAGAVSADLAEAVPTPMQPPSALSLASSLSSPAREVVAASAGEGAGLRALPREGVDDDTEGCPTNTTSTAAPEQHAGQPARTCVVGAAGGVAASAVSEVPDDGGEVDGAEAGHAEHTDDSVADPHSAEHIKRSAVALLSPPSSSTHRCGRAAGDDDDDDDFDSECETQSSCAEFAKVRPDRQRFASVRDDVLFSGSATSAHRESVDDNALLPPRSVDSAAVSLLAHATLPLFLANTTSSTATVDESALQRVAPLRRSRVSPGASDALSPRLHRRRASDAPTMGGITASLDTEEKGLSPESAGTLNGAPWHPKPHMLTPRSSYQSERLRRVGVPSISSCRTVGADDWTGSFDAEGDAPAHDSAVNNTGRLTVPSLREVAQASRRDDC